MMYYNTYYIIRVAPSCHVGYCRFNKNIIYTVIPGHGRMRPVKYRRCFQKNILFLQRIFALGENQLNNIKKKKTKRNEYRNATIYVPTYVPYFNNYTRVYELHIYTYDRSASVVISVERARCRVNYSMKE